jgi:hypothetical protein
VCVCDLEISTMRRSRPDLDSCATENLSLMFQGQAPLNLLEHDYYVVGSSTLLTVIRFSSRRVNQVLTGIEN